MLSVLERELGQTRLVAATEEMSLALQRASRSLYVRETADFACAVADSSGRFIAYPQGIGVSGFVGLDVTEAVRVVREREGLAPGDVILTNDPYTSGALSTHLPDVHAIAPYFEGDEVVGYGWTFIHVSDVGGRVPSSVSVRNDSVFAEGLRIPPVKYVEAGRRVPAVEAFLRANSRALEQNDGDLQAMLAALDRGRARVAELVADHPGGLDEIGAHARAQTAARARRALGRLADGTYRFEDYLDNDAVSDLPLRIAVRATVAEGHLDLDFTGTDPQVEAALNMVTQGRPHSWVLTRLFALVGTLDPDVPLNGGLMDVVSFHAPQGSVLNAVEPAAVGVRHATVSRVNDVVSGALVQAAPDVLPAASSGLVVPVVFAPRASGPGKNLQVVEPMVGGTGGRRGADGLDGRDSGISNLANNPVETVEAAIGVRVLRYAVRPDSAGPGRWRGGSGLELEFEALEPGTLLARGLERTRFQPWGAAGGGPGAVTELLINRGRADEQRLVVVDTVPLEVGDTVTLRTAGAGGYGDPFLRPASLVLADVLAQLVSAEAAERDYGVRIVDGAVDEAATASLRGAARPEPAWWGRGAARERWDAVFPRELLDDLDVHLRTLPRWTAPPAVEHSSARSWPPSRRPSPAPTPTRTPSPPRAPWPPTSSPPSNPPTLPTSRGIFGRPRGTFGRVTDRRIPHYPHTPSSATQLRVGDVVPVADPSGWWGCLQVVELKPRARGHWIYGLLPWRGMAEPTLEDVRDRPPLHRALTRIEVFTEGGLQVTGCTPPADEGQEQFYGPAFIGKSTRVTGWQTCIRLAQQYARTGSDDPRGLTPH